MAVGSLPGQYIYYMSYEYVNELIKRQIANHPHSGKLWLAQQSGLISSSVAGLIAEFTSAFSYLPTDIVSQRLQMERKFNFLPEKFQNRNVPRIVRNIYQTEGLRGFLRGFWPYMIVNGPGSAVWWASYEWCKNILHRRVWTNDQHVHPLNSFISGGFAGITSCLVTNPLDVARTRIQLFEVHNQKEKAKLGKGFVSIVKSIYGAEGFHGLYKGLKPRVLIRAPGSALAFVGYEILKEACLKGD